MSRVLRSSARTESAIRSSVGVNVPGEVDRDREDVGIEDSLHEGRERRPCVALVGDRNLGLVEVPVEAVACQLAEQVLLARVAAIQRPDPDAGPRGHCRNGRVGVLEEDLPGRLEDARVVAARLSLAPAQLALDVVLHLDSIAGFVAEWTGTLRSVPQGESARSVPDVPAGRHHDPTVHDRHPAEPARRPQGPARARSLARRAARRRRLRRSPVVHSEPRRPLADRATTGGPWRRASTPIRSSRRRSTARTSTSSTFARPNRTRSR